MVHPSEVEIDRLKRVAFEMREAVEDSAYLVDSAVNLHPAFRHNRGPAGSLERSLVTDAARAAGRQEGFSVEDVHGGLDLTSMTSDRIRRYRVKSGKLTASGEYQFMCAPNSALLTTEAGSFFIEEQWLLGYLMTDDHLVDQIVAAEIVGHHGDAVTYITLGTVIKLLGPTPPNRFTSTDEPLDDFGPDDDQQGDTGVA